MSDQQPRTWLISLGSGVLVWAFFLSIFAYVFINKYGLLLAYLKSSILLWAAVAIWITYKTSMYAAHYFQENHFHFFFESWLYAIGKVVFPLAFFLLLFIPFDEVRPDKKLLAKITGIPIEAFYPCSGLLSSDSVASNSALEAVAGDLWKARKIGDRYEFKCGSY
jgi:hypothetical protein